MSANPYIAAIGAVVNIGSQVARKIDQNRSREAHQSNIGPLSGGRVLSVEFSGAGQQQVQHLMGKVPTGWLVVGKNATCDIWSYAASDTRFLYLESDAAVTLSLVVF